MGRSRNSKLGHLGCLFVATTGERPSAVLLCRWEHLQDDVLTFPDVKDPRKDGRQVPFIPAVVEAIRSIPKGGPFIWGYETGQPMGYAWFVKRFNAMMNSLGLPESMDGMKRTPYPFKDTSDTLRRMESGRCRRRRRGISGGD